MTKRAARTELPRSEFEPEAPEPPVVAAVASAPVVLRFTRHFDPVDIGQRFLDELPIPESKTRRGFFTPKEVEVFWMLLTSRSVEEIADQLGNTVKTMKHHLASIYQRLGVRSRTAMMALVFGTDDAMPGITQRIFELRDETYERKDAAKL